MDETFIAITVIAFTKISICYNVGDMVVIKHSEKMENNFAKAMLRAMELRDANNSKFIRYRIWTIRHTIVINDDDAFAAIIAPLG